MSVSLDDPNEKVKGKDARTRVLEFLKEKGAGFTNLILDESQELWQEKFQLVAPPCVYVFNRQGKWTKFAEGGHYAEVEKLAVELLKDR
jgi:hypothetical protein